MAVTPVQLTRVSFNQRAQNLLAALRRQQTDMYTVQNELSTGQRFLQPSEDPVGAAAATTLDRRLEQLQQVHSNLDKANDVMLEVDSAMDESLSLLRDAETLVVQAVGDPISAEERATLAGVVDGLLEQLVSVGNRKYLNSYLFSGNQNELPFELTEGGVAYRGDNGRLQTTVDADGAIDSYTVPGAEFFGATSAVVGGTHDLEPAITRATRLSDLGGGSGSGVATGRLTVSIAGADTVVDLAGCDTVGDVVDRLNATLPAVLRADVGPRGLTFTQGAAPVTVRIGDTGPGHVAADLGVAGEQSVATWAGSDLKPRITSFTPLDTLQGGTGLDLSGGLTISNAGRTADVDFTGAATVQDVLNRINQAGVDVWAQIAADGRSIQIASRVCGSEFSIAENGGLAATALGVRTLATSTALADLNDGLGVETVEGDDLRITTADGTTVDVDADGVDTLGALLDRINTAAGGTVTAGLVETGNGLLLTDNTTGTATLRVEALNSSGVVKGLGLDVSADGTRLVGRDVNLLRADSPFTALIELRQGLKDDDRLRMQVAGSRIERVLQQMQRVQGQTASRAKAMEQRTERVETETSATEVLLSNVRDVDWTDAAVRFQQLQTALQANYSVSSQVLNLSLLDYLQ